MSDSPLSIAASVTGLLTFVAAVVAGFYAHALGLRDAIDTQAEISSALDKIYLLETETDMLNNAYLASRIRQPDRKYGTGDFKYFQGLYVHSLERMRAMDRELRNGAELVTKGDGYGRISRVKRKAAWMASRARIQRDIDERKTESIRIFQIQLAMLSAAMHDIASIDDLKDGSKLERNQEGRNLEDPTLEGTSSPINVSSECVVDTSRNDAGESLPELSDTKTIIALPRSTSLKGKRKSWYSMSSKKSEGSKPRAVDQISLCDQTGNLKDRMTTSDSTKHTRNEVSKIPPSNSITIIVTSPTSDAHFKQEDWSSSSRNASSLSLSSLSSTSRLDTTRLMPPPVSSSIQKHPKSNEPPEVKKWLIGCMNRKADTLPRKLVYRMMELYNIQEHELDPKMLDKLRAGMEDEGIVLQIDMEDESKDTKKEESDGAEVLRCLRTSLYSQTPGEGKEKEEKEEKGGKRISGHFSNTLMKKRSSKNNTTTTNNDNNNNNNNNAPVKGANPPKKLVPGANPRIWQNPSSRVRNWPPTNPNTNTNINLSTDASFSFPPYAHAHAHHKHKHTSTHSKRPRTSTPMHNTARRSGVPGSPNVSLQSTHHHCSKRGVGPPRRGSVISLCSIPEDGVSVGFEVGGEGGGEGEGGGGV
ncbi:hypothetical protein DSL72_002866 [Monilinia vaccinii-corymbosi]|uniref:Uncharacterized protein n=1 Tax=Monilinia vaccinii-corymbosi TaxID=61207 RepID=A0A8A3PDT0_9HELO|nr:hypothetical protein DSL72_002866 [Monilinia vaccinii-corymbosi]